MTLNKDTCCKMYSVIIKIALLNLIEFDKYMFY